MLGVDSSEEALKKAERVCRDYKNTKVKRLDLLKLDSNREFDAVICDYVMVHMEEPERIVEKLCRALKRGGFLIVEFLSIGDPSFGKGKPAGHNCFMDSGIFHRFYSLEEAKVLFGKFEILEAKLVRHSDPAHVEEYPRPKKHEHESIYMLAKKK